MLGNYQWVLALDGDNFVLNMQNSLDKWLELHEDVVLHIRWVPCVTGLSASACHP